MLDTVDKVIRAFGLGNVLSIDELPGGHIHRSFTVELKSGKKYLLQKLNTFVFPKPNEIGSNIEKLTKHLLRDRAYPYQVSSLIRTRTGDLGVHTPSGFYWRCMTYIDNAGMGSSNADQGLVFKVAEAFGAFARSLSNFDTSLITDSIPNFHNPVYRKNQFLEALQKGQKKRLDKAKRAIDKLMTHSSIFDSMEAASLPVRVVHNDAKITNVLLSSGNKEIAAIIDLDTVMAGSVVHDFGDLVRSLASSAGEDATSVVFLPERYHAILSGYAHGGGDSLSSQETDALALGAKYIILEQASRFLADYLTGDLYYKISRKDHNLIRANNQLKLLLSMTDQGL